VYGVAIAGDSLANTPVGYDTEAVSIRFRAGHSGELNGLKIHFEFGTRDDFPKNCKEGKDCYGAGDGGLIRVALHADDGSPAHLPAAAELSGISLTPMRREKKAPGAAAIRVSLTCLCTL
jgi:hypothetical protein